MNRATQAVTPGIVPAVKYVLEVKAADYPDPATPPETLEDPNPADPGARSWAGDLYEDGDETDPVQARAAFTADDGSEAWLDKHDDGTLVGWVRDATDDSLYRYTDADAWALDVDGAGMTRADDLFSDDGDGEDTEPDEGEDAAADEETKADPADEPTDELDAAEEPDDLPDPDDEASDMPDEADMQLGDPAEDEDLTTDEDAEQRTDELESDDEDFFTQMKRKREGKALALRVSRAL